MSPFECHPFLTKNEFFLLFSLLEEDLPMLSGGRRSRSKAAYCGPDPASKGLLGPYSASHAQIFSPLELVVFYFA